MEDEIKKLLRASRMLEVGKNNILLHNFINLSVFFLLLCLFLITCLASVTYIPVAIISPVLFGLLFFCFFILVVHEGSHLMFLISTNIKKKRWLNRVFSYPVAALSFQDYIEDWEVGHLEHHRNPTRGGASQDPQNCPGFIHEKIELKREVIKLFLKPGYAFLKQNSCIEMSARFLKRRIALGCFAWGGLLIIDVLFFEWWLIIPQIFSSNVTMALNLIKVSLEHGGENIKQSNIYFRSRSSLFFGRFVLMPMNISLHFEHHLNMHVPWYSLHKFYCETKKNCSAKTLSMIH